MDIALMIEGQDGLTWPRWQRLAGAAEELGLVGLYRSDHFTNARPPDCESLELWTSLTWLATNTRRIEFGPLVSPVSFRHPALTARMAAAVDDLSGGRLQLGLGAGWQEREHGLFGFELLDVEARFRRFEEGLEVVSRLLRRQQPVSFSGDYYQLREASLLPRPQRPGGPPIVIGGNGARRTLPLAARFADEWNGVYLSPADFATRNGRLDALLAAQGRKPADVRRTLMTGVVFGRDQSELAERLGERNRADLQRRGMLVGTPAELPEQIHAWTQAGVQRIMLQWLALDDLDGLAALAGATLGM